MYDPKLNKWGLPQEYKGVYFRPLMINEEDEYEFISNTLTHNKDMINGVYIKMPYLKFILTQLKFEDGKEVVILLQDLLTKITGQTATIYYEESKTIEPTPYLSHITFTLEIGIVKFTEYEFDKIREILIEQNGISLKYIQEYDPTLEESLIFIRRNHKGGNFEEQIFSMCAYLKKPVEELAQTTTFYQFFKFLERARIQLDYELFKPLEISGQISFKDKGAGIMDWLSHIPERGRYDDILIKKDTFVKDNDVFKVSQNK